MIAEVKTNMAAVLQSSLQISKRQLATVVWVSLKPSQSRRNASDMPRIRRPSLAHIKKGGGGRSSFSGIVATVFGPTGLLGPYVCNKLGKHGSQLILPYRGDFYDMMPLKLVGDLGQVLFKKFDLRDEDSIRKSVQYSNVVINLAGRDWETKNFTFNDVHVDGARRLAKIAREEGVEKFIHLSAMNCTPNPTPHILKNGSGFLRSKYHGEIAVREEFPEAVIIRPSIMYGNTDRFLFPYAQPFRRDGRFIPVWKKGEQTIKQPVYVDDVANAVYQAILDPNSAGKTYQGVGPRRYRLSDLIDWFLLELRRYPEEGYRRSDLNWSTLIPRMMMFEMLPGRPMVQLHREIMEREVTTDVVDPKLPTLEDLGVRLTLMEDQVPYLLQTVRKALYYYESLGEFPTPKPAPHLP